MAEMIRGEDSFEAIESVLAFFHHHTCIVDEPIQRQLLAFELLQEAK